MTDIESYSRTLQSSVACKGEDSEDTRLLRAMGREAANYIAKQRWCKGIKEAYLGFGVGGVVAVFLLRIDPVPGTDEWLWVVTGDVPNAYLVTDRSPNAEAALATYCELMSDWVNAVRSGTGLEAVFPVAAPPTLENANALASRIDFIRHEIFDAPDD